VQTNLLAKSNLVQALTTLKDDGEVARKAYLAVLSRLPSPEETGVVSRHLKQRAGAAREEACRELVWALASGVEFRFNH
jgi:hypothetical protein